MTEYTVLSGDAFTVTARNEVEAEMLYHVAVGNITMEEAEDDGFIFTEDDLETVAFVEGLTVVL